MLLLSYLHLCLGDTSSSFPTINGKVTAEERIKSGFSYDVVQKNAATKDVLSSSDTKSVCSSPSEGHQTLFVAECELPTKLGGFRMRSYIHSSETQYLEPVVLINGNIAGKKDVLVRIHDQCFTSEVLGSLRCDCKEQLEGSMRLIKEHEGVLIYLQQEGRGIGLSNKIGNLL